MWLASALAGRARPPVDVESCPAGRSSATALSPLPSACAPLSPLYLPPSLPSRADSVRRPLQVSAQGQPTAHVAWAHSTPQKIHGDPPRASIGASAAPGKERSVALSSHSDCFHSVDCSQQRIPPIACTLSTRDSISDPSTTGEVAMQGCPPVAARCAAARVAPTRGVCR